jgi:hypothetical protein
VTSVAIVLGHAAAVRAGCILLALSLLVLAANVAKIIRHLFRPRIEPLATTSPSLNSRREPSVAQRTLMRVPSIEHAVPAAR